MTAQPIPGFVEVEAVELKAAQKYASLQEQLRLSQADLDRALAERRELVVAVTHGGTTASSGQAVDAAIHAAEVRLGILQDAEPSLQEELEAAARAVDAVLQREAEALVTAAYEANKEAEGTLADAQVSAQAAAWSVYQARDFARMRSALARAGWRSMWEERIVASRVLGPAKRRA